MATTNTQEYEYWGKLSSEDDSVIIADERTFETSNRQVITWVPAFVLTGDADTDGYRKEQKIQAFAITDGDNTSYYIRKKKPIL